MLRKVLRFSSLVPRINNGVCLGQKIKFNFIDKENTDRYTNLFPGKNNLPSNNRFDDSFLELNEIKARTLKVLHDFPEVNIKKLNWDASFKDLGLDSLHRIAFITCVEHEFNIVFADNLFDHINNLD